MNNITTLSINDTHYPLQLKVFLHPPQTLYYEGDINLLNQPNIAVIGTRHCTDYGKRNTKKFVKLLTELNLNIVSGMAIGIDTEAHKACIENGGKTIAVLPSGLQNIYPKENTYLFNQIISSGGLVISEYPPNDKYSPKKAIQRNRIVAGLAMCTVVIEAAFRSGTSITANYSWEQCKPVFCVPGNLENKYSVGTNNLIKKGAYVLTSIEDILSIYPFLNTKSPSTKDINIPSEYIEVYEQITEIAISPEEIKHNLNISISDLNAKLTMLELENYIIQLPGGLYIRNEQ